MSIYLKDYLHDALDRVAHDSTVEAFYHRFITIKSLLAEAHTEIPEAYFATRFAYGLLPEFQSFLFRFHPTTVTATYRLALIFEESLYLDYFPECERSNTAQSIVCEGVLYEDSCSESTIVVDSAEDLFSESTIVIDSTESDKGKGGTIDIIVDDSPVLQQSLNTPNFLDDDISPVGVHPSMPSGEAPHMPSFMGNVQQRVVNDVMAEEEQVWLSPDLEDAHSNALALLFIKELKVHPPDIAVQVVPSVDRVSFTNLRMCQEIELVCTRIGYNLHVSGVKRGVDGGFNEDQQALQAVVQFHRDVGSDSPSGLLIVIQWFLRERWQQLRHINQTKRWTSIVFSCILDHLTHINEESVLQRFCVVYDSVEFVANLAVYFAYQLSPGITYGHKFQLLLVFNLTVNATLQVLVLTASFSLHSQVALEAINTGVSSGSASTATMIFFTSKLCSVYVLCLLEGNEYCVFLPWTFNMVFDPGLGYEGKVNAAKLDVGRSYLLWESSPLSYRCQSNQLGEHYTSNVGLKHYGMLSYPAESAVKQQPLQIFSLQEGTSITVSSIILQRMVQKLGNKQARINSIFFSMASSII